MDNPVPIWILRLFNWLREVRWQIFIASVTVVVAAIVAAVLLPAWKPPLIAFLIGPIAFVWVVFAVWQFPRWQVAGAPVEGAEAAKLENDVRQTLVQAIGGLFVLIGLAFTLQTVQSTNRSIAIAERGQITDRFGKAVELLGSERPQVRAGGIYALEQISLDSPERYHWPIMEILTAHIRQVAPWKAAEQQDKRDRAPADIQAAITVIARRKVGFDNFDQRLNLRRTDLRRVVLTGLSARLKRVILYDSNLASARLQDVDLEKAGLEGVDFTYARLQGANLSGAELTGAKFADACVVGTIFTGADLRGADLRGAIGLTQEQIKSAINDKSTRTEITSPPQQCP